MSDGILTDCCLNIQLEALFSFSPTGQITPCCVLISSLHQCKQKMGKGPVCVYKEMKGKINTKTRNEKINLGMAWLVGDTRDIYITTSVFFHDRLTDHIFPSALNSLLLSLCSSLHHNLQLTTDHSVTFYVRL